MSVPSWAEPYIEQMNGDVARGFFWQDATSFKWYADTQGRSVTFDPKSISYWYGAAAESDYHTDTLGGSTLLTVNVTGSDSSWNMTATGYRRNIDFANGGNIYGSAWQIWKNQDNSYTIQAISAGNPQDALNFSRSALSLESMIQYIADFFKNIKLFVNGEDWTAETTYNWQSVPSISGKNGILSLAQIKDEYINDGESVSGVSADHFTNLSTENRVDVLIDDALPAPEIGGTTVTVKYTIPSLSIGSYEYCKLVAKKNSIPESSEDGDKIVDVDPSSTSITVEGLDELSTYYFAIFIEDDQGNTASSEPKSCKTGRHETNWHVIYENGEIKDGEHLTTDYTITDISVQSITTKNVSFTNEKIIINASDARQGASRGCSINFINSHLPQTLKQIRLTMKVTVNDGGFGGVSYALLKEYPDNYCISSQFNNGDFTHGDTEYIIGDNNTSSSYYAVSTDTYLLTNMSISQNDILRILIKLINHATVNLEITKIEYCY